MDNPFANDNWPVTVDWEDWLGQMCSEERDTFFEYTADIVGMERSAAYQRLPIATSPDDEEKWSQHVKETLRPLVAALVILTLLGPNDDAVHQIPAMFAGFRGFVMKNPELIESVMQRSCDVMNQDMIDAVSRLDMLENNSTSTTN